MEVVTFWCEWDIGCNEDVFATEDAARAAVSEGLKRCRIEENLDELIDEGLLGFQWKTVRT